MLFQNALIWNSEQLVFTLRGLPLNSLLQRSVVMSNSLVIVESPAKSKTLGKFLGADYDVCASMGHIIDLPSNNMGVDIEKRFNPKYVVIPARKKILSELKKRAKKKSFIYLATDPDREGEAISWHLARELRTKEAKFLRVEFHEITKSAIQNAFMSPREIDMNKVDAQQARRILDRIVGYNLSPLLWQKVGRGLSAGRVQSVALRLIVEREREIKAFVFQEYWEIEADLKKLNGIDLFKAKLNSIDGKKPEIAVQNEVDKLVDLIKKNEFIVDSVKEQKKDKVPPQPYTTSKLQQDAFNKLRFQASRTMKLAQELYEGLDIGEEGTTGLITYMRTDSIRISDEAKDEVKKYILSEYGNDYVSNFSHKKRTKQKTQDAHEAIRPTSVNRTPDDIKQYLSPAQYKLYLLIWKRFVQSEMAKAQIMAKTIDIRVETKADIADICMFRSSGSKIIFDGFTRLNGNENEEEFNFPHLEKDEKLQLIELIPSQHFTKPPARFSDASLVKELEDKGIGRPSTYAPTIATIAARHYVQRKEGYLHPTDVGIVVTDLLVKHFPNILNVNFTAEMEDELDKVEEGGLNWVKVLEDFYKEFEKTFSKAKIQMEDIKKISEKTDFKCELCNRTMLFRWSRRGTFLGCSGFPRCKNTKPAKKNDDGVIEIIKNELTDEVCDKCGMKMVIKYFAKGRFMSCSGYPKCKNAKPILTGVKCLAEGCNGDLLERAYKGRIFYGCSNYPNCKYTARKLPLSLGQDTT